MRQFVLLIPLLLLSGCLQQKAPDMKQAFESNMAKCNESQASFNITSGIGIFQTSFRIENYSRGCFLSVAIGNFTPSGLAGQIRLLGGSTSFLAGSMAGSGMACNVSAEPEPKIDDLMFYPGYNRNCKGTYKSLMEGIRKDVIANTLFDLDTEKSGCRDGLVEVHIRNTGKLPIDEMFLNIHLINGMEARLVNMPVPANGSGKIISYACGEQCAAGKLAVITIGNEANTVNFPIKCE
ncbi:MAG: hypothetical protein HYX24_07145 [Candidatus Aenigmarchaeota archaeon]|nr:hypothetical protein [Candidatus Aenigmarchaeota archaeon]